MFVANAVPDSSEELTTVIARFDVDTGPVLVTRGGGLFTSLPKDLAEPTPIGPLDHAQWNRKGEFHEQSADRFNMILCELALLGGSVAEPVSPLYVQLGSVIDNHALMNSASASGPTNTHRQIPGPLAELLSDDWRAWIREDEALPRNASALSCAWKLRSASASLPTLVAAAYAHYTFIQTAEAHAISSIVTEAIIGSIWRQHVAEQQGPRRRRLEDTRTYSISVRLKVLLTAGLISDSLYARSTKRTGPGTT
jgi:hypothetical protein